MQKSQIRHLSLQPPQAICSVVHPFPEGLVGSKQGQSHSLVNTFWKGNKDGTVGHVGSTPAAHPHNIHPKRGGKNMHLLSQIAVTQGWSDVKAFLHYPE